ncbi:MAG: mechanosensitive ion channel [Rhizobium sp.]|nr:mechanosensitive ion channel [Rhizobium sp.]
MAATLTRNIATMLFLLLLPVWALAQEARDPPATSSQLAVTAVVEALQAKVRGELEAAALALEDLKVKVDGSDQADAALAELKVEVDNVNSAIVTSLDEIAARLALVSKRIEELGQPPADGQTEDAALTADRKRLQAEKAQISAIMSDGELIRNQAGDLSDQIVDMRRTLFSETIFRHTELSGELFGNAWLAATQTWRELKATAVNALEFMWRFKHQSLFLSLGVTIVLAIVLAVVLRRFLGPLIYRDPNYPDPQYIHRLSVAFWSATIPAISWAIVIACGLGFLYGFNVLRSDLFDILRAAAWAIVGVYYVWKLARGIVSPGKPRWRLIEVSDTGARRIVIFAVVLALINGLTYVLSSINVVLDAPLVLTVVESLISSIVTGITLVFLSFLRPMGGAPKEGVTWPRAIRFLVLMTGIGLIVTTLLGYIGLAKFASSQIVVTGAIIVTMYVGFLAGNAISRHDAFAKTALGLMLSRRYRLGEVRLDQLGLVSGLLSHMVVLLIGIPLIMLTWGFRGADISVIFVRLFTEIRVGNINISLLGILAGIVLFFAGLIATRWFQRWLDGTVLARSHVETGVRNSVNTVLGYVGIVLAALLGISAAGFDLSSLALVAGALSLGIGFGLQTIVQNFVSGLILLVERPFKVGDWIVNGPAEGFVRRISVRATEIETFQNQSIIVPNSQLINASVGNWTLRNTLARSEIPVSVAYDSDPRRVMELLLEIARSHPLVLTMPEPNVGFQAFGQSSLDFELRFHLADIFQGGPVRNEIRVAIIERFRQEGIEMPLPQRDLNIRVKTEGSAGALEDALSDEGLPPEVVRRIVARAEHGIAKHPRGRKVDIADDDDGSPFDGMHHALRDDDDHDDGEGDEPPQTR